MSDRRGFVEALVAALRPPGRAAVSLRARTMSGHIATRRPLLMPVFDAAPTAWFPGSDAGVALNARGLPDAIRSRAPQ